MTQNENKEQFVETNMTTKEKIVFHAGKLFSQHGYHGTSLDMLAKACGVKKPSLLHHYASKQEIALNTFKNLQNYCEKSIFAIAHDEAITCQEKLQQFAVNVEHFFTEHPYSALPSALATEVVDSIEAFNQPIQCYFDTWQKFIKQIFITKQQKIEDRTASQYLNQIHGALLMQRIYHCPSYIKHACQQIFNTEQH